MRGAAPVPAKRIMSRWAQSPLRHQRSLQCLKETRLQCFTAHGTTFSILPLKEKKEKLFVFLEGSSTFRLSAASARQKVLEKKKQFQKKKKKKAKLFLPHQQHLFLFWAILRTNKDMYKNRKIIGKSPRKTAEKALGISRSWQ